MNASLITKHCSERDEEWCVGWLMMQSRRHAVSSVWTDELLCIETRSQESWMWGQATNRSPALRPKEGETINVRDWDSKLSCLSTASAKQWHYAEMASSRVTVLRGHSKGIWCNWEVGSDEGHMSHAEGSKKAQGLPLKPAFMPSVWGLVSDWISWCYQFWKGCKFLFLISFLHFLMMLLGQIPVHDLKCRNIIRRLQTYPLVVIRRTLTEVSHNKTWLSS